MNLDLPSDDLVHLLNFGYAVLIVAAPFAWVLLKRLLSTSTPLDARTIDDRLLTGTLKSVIDMLRDCVR